MYHRITNKRKGDSLFQEDTPKRTKLLNAVAASVLWNAVSTTKAVSSGDSQRSGDKSSQNKQNAPSHTSVPCSGGVLKTSSSKQVGETSVGSSTSSVQQTTSSASTDPHTHSPHPTSLKSAQDKAIMDICKANVISVEEYEGRVRLVNQLHRTITSNSEFRKRYPKYCNNLGLFIIGSSKTGLGVKSNCGDLDICMMISYDEMSKSQALDILRLVDKIMRPSNIYRDLQVISAIVPILMFKLAQSNTTCDLNINNFVGLRNSHLLHCYAIFDWRVKPLVLFIKKWAKFQDINSARHKTICSYALTLMVINYLQCGVGSKPILPCLQSEYPHFFPDDVQVLSTTDLVFRPYPPQQQNHMSLNDLLLGFFDRYANHFRFEDSVMSVRCGRVLTLAEVSRDQLKRQSQPSYLNTQTPSNSYGANAQMFVEEPFNLTNVARSVYDAYTFRRIKQVFERSYERLRITADPYSIITTRV